MSSFWSLWVIILTVINIVACYLLVGWVTKKRAGESESGETTGHIWDGLQELNNPLPNWWLQMYYLTIVFSIGYLALYPGMGNFAGLLGWTKEGQHAAEMQAAEEKYGPIFAQYAGIEVEKLVENEDAIKLGRSLFSTYCTVCHGSDARGAIGYPDLTDNDWLFGGSPEMIKTSIAAGRTSIGMPAYGKEPFNAQLKEDEIDQVVAYVQTLAGREADAAQAEAGKAKFTTVCAACHLPDGTGNPALGAPNLTDKVWLYGGSAGAIKNTIVHGQKGIMPAQQEFLGDDKIHLLTTYVYSLSQEK